MTEKIVIGDRTTEMIKGPCSELASVDLMAAGRTIARSPYEVMRAKIRGGHIIATFGGAGELWHDGKWLPLHEGNVALIPPFEIEAFRAVTDQPWSFCWLHTYPKFFMPSSATGTRVIEADSTLFRHAVEGFIHSSYSEGLPENTLSWANLIRFYGQRFMSRGGAALRLEKLWAIVSSEPGRKWNATDLAKIAGMSREQLRIQARLETDRSPMEQVTHLRMLRAIEIIQTFPYKQEQVAEMVGYSCAFAFSAAFLKHTGKRPSFYRTKT
jgi:AraC-like DNA-binding protein